MAGMKKMDNQCRAIADPGLLPARPDGGREMWAAVRPGGPKLAAGATSPKELMKLLGEVVRSVVAPNTSGPTADRDGCD